MPNNYQFITAKASVVIGITGIGGMKPKGGTESGLCISLTYCGSSWRCCTGGGTRLGAVGRLAGLKFRARIGFELDLLSCGENGGLGVCCIFITDIGYVYNEQVGQKQHLQFPSKIY